MFINIKIFKTTLSCNKKYLVYNKRHFKDYRVNLSNSECLLNIGNGPQSGPTFYSKAEGGGPLRGPSFYNGTKGRKVAHEFIVRPKAAKWLSIV